MLCQEEGQGAKSKTQGPKRGRENFVSAAIGDEVLVWGGIKASQQMVDSAVWSFNVRTCKWRMLHNGKGTRPEPTELAASFVIQDTLYIHGGGRGARIHTIARRWRRIPQNATALVS